MEFFKPGKTIDFMKYRTPVLIATGILVLLSLGTFVFPGANYGIDFKGGTELELRFKGDTSVAEVRAALTELGYSPDVVNVEGRPRQFIVRVSEVSAIPDELQGAIRERIAGALGEVQIDQDGFKVSPGGDKVTVRLSGEADPQQLQEAVEAGGVRTRSANAFGRPEDHRYEIHLVGVADRIVEQLTEKFGERGPEEPLRIEWMGPKAGQQLREAALKSLLYAIVFIMVYVAFRFDLRFAPGGVIALVHDAIVMMGIYNLFQREVNLTTVAAVLTIVGYSINDTIVTYDRIRENMVKMRDRSLYDLINLSTTQTLSRTIITAGTVLLSVLAFFIWGTDVIKDLAFALFIGIIVGSYSSIYVAAPITELMDEYVFRRKDTAPVRGKKGTPKAATASS